MLCSYGRRFTSLPLAHKPSQHSGDASNSRNVSAFRTRRPFAWSRDRCIRIMPDHLHLFVATDDEQIAISAWMKSLKNTISKTRCENEVAPPHWQKTFFDHLLRSSESYSERWKYVRENPVRAGLVTSPQDWPYMEEIFALEYRSEK